VTSDQIIGLLELVGCVRMREYRYVVRVPFVGRIPAWSVEMWSKETGSVHILIKVMSEHKGTKFTRVVRYCQRMNEKEVELLRQRCPGLDAMKDAAKTLEVCS